MSSTEAGDISSLLMSVLSDPQTLGKIMDSFSGKNNEKHEKEVIGTCDSCDIIEASAVECNPVKKCDCKCDRNSQAKNRRRLIEALEPYLSHERCEAAKKLILFTELLDSGDSMKGGQ